MPLRFREKLILSDSQTAECSKKMISNFRAMNDKVIESNTVYKMLDHNVNGAGYSSKDKEYWANVKVKFRNNLNEYVEAKKSQMQISGMQHFYQFLSTMTIALFFSLGDTAFGIGDLLYVRCFSMVIMTWVRLQWMFSAMLIILGFVIFMTSRLKIESLLSHYRFDR